MSRADYIVWFIFMGAATAAILIVAVGIASGSFGHWRHASGSSDRPHGEPTPARRHAHSGRDEDGPPRVLDEPSPAESR